MASFNLPPELVERFRAFLKSESFRAVPAHAKSEYWRDHAAAINVEVTGNRVSVAGRSGDYIPRSRNGAIGRRFLRAVANPKKVPNALRRAFTTSPNEGIRLLPYEDAFRAVMSHAPIASVVRSPHRLDFAAMKGHPGIIGSIEEMRKDAFLPKKYTLNTAVILAYYLQNVIVAKVSPAKVGSVLDIGAGNGNLAGLLRHRFGARIVIVDLPETLCLSIPFLSDLFPTATVSLPNELADGPLPASDLTFLTPAQTSHITDDTIDLATNTSSFQEMTHPQIDDYFRVVQRAVRRGGHFLSLNRVEKIPAGDGSAGKPSREWPNRSSEYPWNPQNLVLVNEVCRFMRLVQLDDSALRLERVEK